jgi:glutathione S-transferase
MTMSPPVLLRTATASPFGRKVKIAAHVLGLMDSIKIVLTNTLDPADPVRNDNPLGKIPTLVLADGSAVYDSRVILEYLDLYAGGGIIIPNETGARFANLRLQAIADGLCDAAILQIYETRFRAPEKHEATWLSHQVGKVDRSLDYLETLVLPNEGDRPGVGGIALACALGYLDLRFGGLWRDSHPQLASWSERFEAAVPSFAATRATA